MSDNKMNTKVEGRELVMERIFDAPRDLVFKTFSKSEHLAAWWGPAGWETENRQFEFEPGGVWHFCMRCADKNQGDLYGQESWGKAVFHEIVEPEKIVYTDSFSDAEGNTMEEMPSIQITILFVEHEDNTKLIVRSQFASAEALQQVMDMGVVQGFSSQFDGLDDLLKALQLGSE